MWGPDRMKPQVHADARGCGSGNNHKGTKDTKRRQGREPLKSFAGKDVWPFEGFGFPLVSSGPFGPFFVLFVSLWFSVVPPVNLRMVRSPRPILSDGAHPGFASPLGTGAATRAPGPADPRGNPKTRLRGKISRTRCPHGTCAPSRSKRAGQPPKVSLLS